MSNSKFISAINDQIQPLLKAFTGSRIYGLTQPISKPVGQDQFQTIPCIVDNSGEAKYVGVDDAALITIYHKSNTLTITEKANSGSGDVRAYTVYTYYNSMIVFIDRKRTGMLPDEFALLLQANLKDAIKIENFRAVVVRLQNIILNSQQVFATEYQNTEYRISPQFSLFAINYQIESTFDKRCFATCPQISNA